MAASICAMLVAVQASRVSWITDCSAQAVRPKSACRAGSARSPRLITTIPCVPASMSLNQISKRVRGPLIQLHWGELALARREVNLAEVTYRTAGYPVAGVPVRDRARHRLRVPPYRL